MILKYWLKQIILLPADITLKNVVILIICVINDGDEIYPQTVFRRSISSIKIVEKLVKC